MLIPCVPVELTAALYLAGTVTPTRAAIPVLLGHSGATSSISVEIQVVLAVRADGDGLVGPLSILHSVLVSCYHGQCLHASLIPTQYIAGNQPKNQTSNDGQYHRVKTVYFSRIGIGATATIAVVRTVSMNITN